MEEKRKISIGMEDFKTIIDKNGYFVDKTFLIKELLDSNTLATLFTRPRRFGKTLNLSMLRYFFEDARKDDGTPVDNRYLFDGLAIRGYGDKYLQHQQQYPVIQLSLKSGKQSSYELAYGSLKVEIENEFQRHEYILKKDLLSAAQREKYERILMGKGADLDYAVSLKFLSQCLEKYHGKKSIILIDEYDVPLENAYFCGFYDEMIGFIRSLFEAALKTNTSLEFAVITGCLRISKESIFTGLNNLEVNTVQSLYYSDAFGFTEAEVQALLKYYNLEGNLIEVKQWYDGYRFGTGEIYNPWSILNYVKNAKMDADYLPRPYWSNTSSNSIVRQLIHGADNETRQDIEQLLAGKIIKKPIHEDITYGDIDKSQDNLWNFLYFTGYLKAVSEELRLNRIYAELAIPNQEVKMIYQDTILEWFNESIAASDLSPLRKALESGDCEAAGDFLNEKLMETISYYDYDETYYHGFLAGILSGIGGYLVQSNRESGEGRPDIILKETKFRGRAMILELKVTKDITQMEAGCMEALRQIDDMQYEAELTSEGYKIANKYGICFFKKGCLVMCK